MCPEVTIRNSIVKGETRCPPFKLKLKKSKTNNNNYEGSTTLCFCYVCAGLGFNMMEAFGLTQRAHSSVEGVAAEPFVFNTLPTYTLYRDVQLTQSTK